MKKNKLMIFLFIMPAVLCLLFMFVYPVTRTVIMSFFRVESLTASADVWSFNGLDNYIKIFNSTGFRQAMKNMERFLIVFLQQGQCLLSCNFAHNYLRVTNFLYTVHLAQTFVNHLCVKLKPPITGA